MSSLSPETRGRRWPKIIAWTVAGVLVLNLALATVPVAVTLSRDDRNKEMTLVARFGYYLDPTTLTLDLWDASGASTADLTRALFQIAASREAWPPVRHVTLSRRGTPMFILSGDDFKDLGKDFDAGENPVYLMRTLPQRLQRPSGGPAFATWRGGVIGVLGEQMDDLNSFGHKWALGSD